MINHDEHKKYEIVANYMNNQTQSSWDALVTQALNLEIGENKESAKRLREFIDKYEEAITHYEQTKSTRAHTDKEFFRASLEKQIYIFAFDVVREQLARASIKSLTN